MIICTQAQYNAARAANPGEVILCEDARIVHMPGADEVVVRISPWRCQKALESDYSERFVPEPEIES